MAQGRGIVVVVRRAVERGAIVVVVLSPSPSPSTPRPARSPGARRRRPRSAARRLICLFRGPRPVLPCPIPRHHRSASSSQGRSCTKASYRLWACTQRPTMCLFKCQFVFQLLTIVSAIYIYKHSGGAAGTRRHCIVATIFLEEVQIGRGSRELDLHLHVPGPMETGSDSARPQRWRVRGD